MGILFAARQFFAFRKAALTRRAFWTYLLTAVLIASNWLVYVWAVNHNFIIEASLGYFINPLISVTLAVLFLRERLRPIQWIPITLAAVGVGYLTLVYGRIPWIALYLAFSFSLYGLVKKLAPLGSLFGLTLETGILFIPALIFLVCANIFGGGAFLRENRATDSLLIGAGGITSLTLFMFSFAAQKLPLSVLGIMEYVAPTLAFLLGMLVYNWTLAFLKKDRATSVLCGKV